MQIHEAAENYLETIHILIKRHGYCRAIDVCRELGYSKPTVSIVMKQFRENHYINTDSKGYITLTEKGLAIAERMYERHEIIAKFLITLGVPEEIAYNDACKMEHDISEISFSIIKEYYLRISK